MLRDILQKDKEVCLIHICFIHTSINQKSAIHSSGSSIGVHDLGAIILFIFYLFLSYNVSKKTSIR